MNVADGLSSPPVSGILGVLRWVDGRRFGRGERSVVLLEKYGVGEATEERHGGSQIDHRSWPNDVDVFGSKFMLYILRVCAVAQTTPNALAREGMQRQHTHTWRKIFGRRIFDYESSSRDSLRNYRACRVLVVFIRCVWHSCLPTNHLRSLRARMTSQAGFRVHWQTQLLYPGFSFYGCGCFKLYSAV